MRGLLLLPALAALAAVDAAAVGADPLQMTVAPETVVLGVTPSLAVACRAAGLTDIHMSMIMSMFHHDVNGSVTLVARQITGTTILVVDDSRYSADGSAKGIDDSNESFLAVNINNPGEAEEGYYRCNFEYFNNDYDRSDTYSAGVNVSVVPENVTEIFVAEPENATCCCCAEVKAEIAELRASLWTENRMLKQALANKGTAGPPREAGACAGTAFTARFISYNNDEWGPDFDQDMPLYFDDVIANHGDAYDSSSGTFTAPCAGSYLFSLTLRAYQNYNPGQVMGVISVNGVGMARTYQFYDHDMYNDDAASVTVTLTLQAGDDVTTSLETESRGKLGGGQYSAFVGAFLG